MIQSLLRYTKVLALILLLFVTKAKAQTINLISNPATGGFKGIEIFSFGNNIYSSYYSQSDNSTKLAKFDGNKVTLISHPDSGTGYIGNPIVYGNNVYFSYLSKSSNYSYAKFDGNTITMIKNPIGGRSCGANPIVYKGNLYFQCTSTNGGFQLAKYDGDSITMITHNDGVNVYEGNPIVFNNNLYFQYYKPSTGQELLAQFDGTNLTLIPNPVGGSGYNGYPIIYQNNLYLQYGGANGKQLAKFDGTSITLIANPDGGGYAGIPIVYGNNLCIQYYDENFINHLAKYDGNKITLIDNPDAGSGYSDNGVPIIYGNNLVFEYLGAKGGTQLAKYDGNSITLTDNPDAGIGMAGKSIVIFNSKLYVQYWNANNIYQIAKYDGKSVSLFYNFDGGQGIADNLFLWGNNLYFTYEAYKGSAHLAELNICTPSNIFIPVTASGSYNWHGKTYTNSGSYTYDTLNVDGCDSLTTLKLCLTSYRFVPVTASGSYTWHGTTYTTSTTSAIYDTVNSVGCDSITGLALTIIPVSTWTGTASSDWFDPSNWSNSVPDSTTDIVIPAGTPNSPTIGSGIAYSRNITIATGATLTNNATLELYGKMSNNGTFTSSPNSNLELKGALSMYLNGKNTIGNLIVDATYGVGGASTDMVSVNSILKKKSGLLVTSNKLTLVSNANSSAMIQEAGGTLFGKAYIQHYAGGSFGFHHFSSPISDGTVNSWANAFPIFGPDGTPGWLSPRGSLQIYNEPANQTSILDSSYYNYTNLSSPLVPGQGYSAWLNSLPTLNTFGTPNNGPIAFPVTNTSTANANTQGWNLVGNPYPSPISWTSLKALNPLGLFGDASCYLWQADGDSTNGTWATFDGNVGANGARDVINSSLGFFIYVNNSGTLNFDNSVRTYNYTSPEIFGKKLDATNTLKLSIKSIESKVSDEAVAYTSHQASFSRKMPQPATATNPTIAFDVKGTKAAINVLTAIDSKTELPITILTPKAGNYTLSLNTKGIDLPVYLKDGFKGTYTELLGNITITTTATETSGRYSIVFSNAASLTTNHSQLTTYPNPAKSSVMVKGSHIASVQVVDNLGRIIETISLKDATNPTLNVRGLSAGAYHLRIQTTDGKVNGANLVVSY